MAAKSLESAEEVLKYVARNQVKGSVEENYISKISTELDMARNTVSRKIDHLKTLGLVKRERRGQKKVVLVNEDLLESIDYGPDLDKDAVWDKKPAFS
ncbi:MAG: hypothetical protein ABEJ93_02780 [Candidatus Nanohalobium sp.]